MQFSGQAKNGQGATRMFVNGGSRNGMRPVSGEVISADANSITVKSQDGSSKIVILSGSTKFVKTAEVAKNDITKGIQVGVFGTENTDGSITATNIQINPQQIIAAPNTTGTQPKPEQ